MLYEASKVADVLIVAVNSDSSVKKYKSQKRPIIPLRYRLEMLAAIGFIDYLTWFDETDPRAILQKNSNPMSTSMGLSMEKIALKPI